MRKFIVSVLALLLSVAAFCGTADKSRLNSVIERYRGTDGFEVINFKPITLSLVKAVAKTRGVSAFKDVKTMEIIAYEECPEQLKKEIGERFSDALDGNDLILEAKDTGDIVRIYGTVEDESDVVKDIVLLNLSDGMLMRITGKINLNDLAQMSQMD